MTIEIEKGWLENLIKRSEEVEVLFMSKEADVDTCTAQLNQLFGYISSAKFILERGDKNETRKL